MVHLLCVCLHLLVGGLEHEFYDFPYIGNGKSSQLTKSYFSEGFKPPTRFYFCFEGVYFSCSAIHSSTLVQWRAATNVRWTRSSGSPWECRGIQILLSWCPHSLSPSMNVDPMGHMDWRMWKFLHLRLIHQESDLPSKYSSNACWMWCENRPALIPPCLEQLDEIARSISTRRRSSLGHLHVQ